ncbi:Sugar transporter, partial [Operophtera brumata]
FLVAFSPQLAAISVGGSVTYPTLLLQQLRSNDSSIQLDMHTGSWVGSIYGLAGLAAILTPIFMQWRGRKSALIVTCCSIAIGWVLSYSATSIAMILISECFHGFGTNSLLPVALMSMTEMLAPEYRFLSMQLFGINQGAPIAMRAIGGIAGQFLSFRTISLIMLIPVTIAIMIALMWPEGTDELSKKELAELITPQKENLSVRKQGKRMTLKSFWSQITSRDFYVPSLHIYLLLNLLYWSGGDVVLIYFIELVSKSTKNENATFYAGIILYSIVLIGCLVNNVIIRFFKNKTILLTSTFGVTLSLIGICIVTYLQSVGIVPSHSLLCMYFLISFMVCNSFGMNAVVFYIGAELMPVKHRNIGGSMYIIYNCGLYASTLKISPYMIHFMDMWGTFLIFTLNIIISSYLVWKYVPETKGRTLQEIEDYYTYGKFIQRTIDTDVSVHVLKINKV